jgi:hypothetical protein
MSAPPQRSRSSYVVRFSSLGNRVRHDASARQQHPADREGERITCMITHCAHPASLAAHTQWSWRVAIVGVSWLADGRAQLG